MAYMALYRKFRPADFNELIGQEPIARTLANAVKSGGVVHAYLFCGPRGTGKTSAARIFARAINCQNPKDGSPCLSCPACLRIGAGESMDILEIDAASNRGVDDSRDLREKVKFAPAQEKRKVYIIDEVHMMTSEAFNALLKTLEDPPDSVVFILATTEPHRLPVTVLSRCQRFDFRRISESDIEKRLLKIAGAEGISINSEALSHIAGRSGGALRDAIGLLDQCANFAPGGVTAQTVSEVLGTVDSAFLDSLLTALEQSDLETTLKQAGELIASGKDLRQFIYDAVTRARDLLIRDIRQKKDPGRLFQIVRALQETEPKLRFSLIPAITLELALIAICGEGGSSLSRTSGGSPAKADLSGKPPAAAPAPRSAGPAAAPPKRPPEGAKTPPPVPEVKPAGRAEKPGIDLTRFKAAWGNIRKKIAQESPSLNAYLERAKPAAAEGNVLTVAFPAGYALFMNNAIGIKENKAILERIASGELNAEVRIKAVLAPDEPETEANIPEGGGEPGLFGAEWPPPEQTE